MKKAKIIGIVLVAIAMLSFPLVTADTQDITGNFTPSSSVSAELWNTTMSWGSLGASQTGVDTTQINNTGDTNIDVTIQYKDTATDLTLTAGAPGEDQYRVEQNGTGSWTDVTGSYTSVTSNLAPSANKEFQVRVTMGSSFTQDWGQQWHNNTVQYVAHT
jgi:hypothetical protein